MATYFKGGSFDEQNRDPIIGASGIVASGQYRDIPRDLIEAYMTGRASQEDTMAAIKGTPVFNASIGPQMDTGKGNQPYDATKIQQNSVLNDAKAKLQAMQTRLPQNGGMASPQPSTGGTGAAPAPAQAGGGQGAAGSGAVNTGVDPAASAGAQAILDASHAAAVSGATPPTSASSSLLDTFKQLMGSMAPPPAPPSEVSTFQNLNAAQGVDQAQNDYNNAKANLQKIQNDIISRQNDIKSQQGPQITSAVINGQLTYVDAKAAAALQQAQTQVQIAADTLNMKQGVVSQLMQYTQADYQNASQYYQDSYKRNIDMLNAFEGIIGTQDAMKKTAMANINIVQGMIADKPTAFTNPTQDQRTLWNQLEVQAGLPIGTIEGYAKARPGAKTILHYANPDGTTSIVAVDASGQIIHDQIANSAQSGGAYTAPETGSTSPTTGKKVTVSDTQAIDLVEGRMGPDQLSKRAANYKYIIDQADKYSMQMYGKHFDPAKSERDWKFANNPQTQNTLNYLSSLVGGTSANPTGNLDSLITLSDKIDRTSFPAVNSAEFSTLLATGDVQTAQYLTAVTEVADQVAKILQGGGAGGGTTDSKLAQAQAVLSGNFTKDQIKGIATTLKDLLANRQDAMTRDNPYLKDYKTTAASKDTSGGGSSYKSASGHTYNLPF